MSQGNCLVYKLTAILLLLILFVPIMIACDDDDKGNGSTSTTSDAAVDEQNQNTVGVGVPEIEGPITGPGEPFDVAIAAGAPLADVGYEGQEFFMSGTATSYRAINDLPDNGMWEVEPEESATYKTRFLVYKPIDPDTFNGTVVMEWLNVSAGIESAPDYKLIHTELLRRGYAWIGVSAQYVGVEGGQAAVAVVDMPLKKEDPERYGSLSHPGDSYCYDIFSQAANAIRNPDGVDPLAGYNVERILAIGHSQSAFRLATYINAVQPLAKLFDGFLVHGKLAWVAPLGDFNAGIDTADHPAVYIRTDLDTPVLLLNAESDVLALGHGGDEAPGGYAVRQDDTANFHLWEMAGTAHSDLYQTSLGGNDDGTDPSVANVAEVIKPNPLQTCEVPINSGPQHFIEKAAIYQLDKWVRTGTRPPTAERLEIAGDPPAFVLDESGNVKGGVRTPYVDVPIAKLSGGGQPAGSPCLSYGTTKLFDKNTLIALYPDHATYVTAVENATDAAVQAGFLMPEDGETIKAAARASDIGNP